MRFSSSHLIIKINGKRLNETMGDLCITEHSTLELEGTNSIGC